MTARKDGIYLKLIVNVMREIKPHEIYNIAKNYKDFDRQTLDFWILEINKRLEYLSPLLLEMKKLNIELKTVSKELNQEVCDISDMKVLLSNYLVKNFSCYSCKCGLRTDDYLKWKHCDCK